MTKKKLKFIGIEVNKGVIRFNFDKALKLSKKDMVKIEKDCRRRLLTAIKKTKKK